MEALPCVTKDRKSPYTKDELKQIAPASLNLWNVICKFREKANGNNPLVKLASTTMYAANGALGLLESLFGSIGSLTISNPVSQLTAMGICQFLDVFAQDTGLQNGPNMQRYVELRDFMNQYLAQNLEGLAQSGSSAISNCISQKKNMELAKKIKKNAPDANTINNIVSLKFIFIACCGTEQTDDRRNSSLIYEHIDLLSDHESEKKIN